MANKLFFLLINMFLLICLIATTSSAPADGTPAQCKFSVPKKRIIQGFKS